MSTHFFCQDVSREPWRDSSNHRICYLSDKFECCSLIMGNGELSYKGSGKVVRNYFEMDSGFFRGLGPNSQKLVINLSKT